MPITADLYQTALQNIVAIPLPERTQLEITGRDRATFLHNFCTNQIKTLPVDQGCEVFIPNIKGRILFHGLVFMGAESLWFETVPGQAAALIAHLDRYLISEDVQLVDRTHDLAQIYLTGAQAAEHLSAILGEPLTVNAEPGQVTTAGGSLVRRFAFGLGPGYSFVVPRDEQAGLLSVITQLGIPVASMELFEALRIEAGYPHSGIDLTEEHLAQEASRTRRAISFTKGCYLGQEPIARLDALGHVNKAFAGIETLESAPLAVGAEVFATPDATAAAGQLTSVAVHPLTGRTMGLGVLKKALLANGTPCFVGPQRVAARVKVWEQPH